MANEPNVDRQSYSSELKRMISMRDALYVEHMENHRIGGMTLVELRKHYELVVGSRLDNVGVINIARDLIRLSGEAFEKLRNAQSMMDMHATYMRRRRAQALTQALEQYGSVMTRLPSKEQSALIDSLIIDDIVNNMLAEADVHYWKSVVEELDRIGWRHRDMTIATASDAKRLATHEPDGDVSYDNSVFKEMVEEDDGE